MSNTAEIAEFMSALTFLGVSNIQKQELSGLCIDPIYNTRTAHSPEMPSQY